MLHHAPMYINAFPWLEPEEDTVGLTRTPKGSVADLGACAYVTVLSDLGYTVAVVNEHGRFVKF